jgi:hypothetical protein
MQDENVKCEAGAQRYIKIIILILIYLCGQGQGFQFQSNANRFLSLNRLKGFFYYHTIKVVKSRFLPLVKIKATLPKPCWEIPKILRNVLDER